MNPLLSVDRLRRTFGGLVAVDDVSFSVSPGEIFGLIGPNGAGKTTLFNLMTGLTPPTSGSIHFDGAPITGFPPHRIAALGIARTFQNIRLFKGMSALENILVARHCRTRSGLLRGILGLPGVRSEEVSAREKSYELLELIGLSHRADEAAGTFSYGDQRRLEIGRALALDPHLLLLDEPAAGMNSAEKQGLTDFIRMIHQKQGLTVILIEHHVPLVMGLCDRIAVLNFGELIAVGPPEKVQNDPAVIEAYLGGVVQGAGAVC